MLEIGTVIGASFRAVGSLYALAFVGIVLVLADVIHGEHLRVLSRICYVIFLPCLVLLAVTDTVRNADLLDLWTLPFFAVLHWIVGFICGLVTYYGLGPPHEDHRGKHPLRLAVVGACISSNSADIPLALISILKGLALFTEAQGIVREEDDVALRVTGYIALYNVLNILYSFTFAYHLFSRAGLRFPYQPLSDESSATVASVTPLKENIKASQFEDDGGSSSHEDSAESSTLHSSGSSSGSGSGSGSSSSSSGGGDGDGGSSGSSSGSGTRASASASSHSGDSTRSKGKGTHTHQGSKNGDKNGVRSSSCLTIVRNVFNPVFTSSLLGIVIGAIQPLGDQFVSGGSVSFIFEFLTLLGRAYVPLVMLTLGANIYINGMRSGDASLPRRTLLSIGVVKLVILPALAIGLVQLGIHWDWIDAKNTMLQFVLISVMITPCATFLVIFSQLFNYAIGSFARMVFWQYVACIATLPGILVATLSLIQSNADG